MRTIKFRAWTGKKMLYQDKQYLASFIRRLVPEIILDHGGETFSQHESYLPNGGVIDEYLQQFTGLVDKNGKDIYEGDIIRTENEQENDYPVEAQFRGIVTYEESKAWFYIQQSHATYKPLLANSTIQSIEVIGNIYESEPRP